MPGSAPSPEFLVSQQLTRFTQVRRGRRFYGIKASFPLLETLRDNHYAMALRPWNHNMHHYDFVLRWVVPGCRRALDVGCGQSVLARRLAQCCKEVIAIDVDHDVIFRARASSSSDSSIRLSREV